MGISLLSELFLRQVSLRLQLESITEFNFEIKKNLFLIHLALLYKKPNVVFKRPSIAKWFVRVNFNDFLKCLYFVALFAIIGHFDSYQTKIELRCRLVYIAYLNDELGLSISLEERLL